MNLPFRGGCACGTVRYECSAAPASMLNCHCRDCQVASGSAYCPTVIVATGAVHVMRGEVTYFKKKAASGNITIRAFCGRCGTPLFVSNSARPGYTGIQAGSLDDPKWFSPQADLWVASAQPWDHLDPSIAKFEKGRPPTSQYSAQS